MRLGDYYPDIRWIEAGTVAGGSLLARSGYFVLAECGRIECCRPTGPFATKEEAREWSRKNLLPEAGQT
jgi:hypothetical protein